MDYKNASVVISIAMVLLLGLIWLGSVMFVAFVRMYRSASLNWNMKEFPILRYIAERPQVDK